MFLSSTLLVSLKIGPPCFIIKTIVTYIVTVNFIRRKSYREKNKLNNSCDTNDSFAILG